MANTNRFQFCFAKEDQPGVGITVANLFTAANAKIIPTSLSSSFNKQEFDRQQVKPNLSPTTPLKGVVDGTVNMTFELAGVTSGSPSWTTLLQSCGMEELAIDSMAATSITVGSPAAFHHNELCDGSTAGQWLVVKDTYDTDTTLYGVDQAVSISGATMTGAQSGSVMNIGAITSGVGYAWSPISDRKSTVDITSTTGTISAGDVLQGDTSGALIQTTEAWADGPGKGFRYLSEDTPLTAGELLNNRSQVGTTTLNGNETQTRIPSLTLGFVEDGNRRVFVGCRGKFTISSNAIGEPVVIACEWRGKLASDANVDGAEILSVTPDALTPPPFVNVGSQVGLNSDTFENETVARITRFSVGFDNTLAVERDATESEGVAGAVQHSDRTCPVELAVSLKPESDFPYLDNLIAGTSYRWYGTFGTAAGNKFILSVPTIIGNSESVEDDEGFAKRVLGGSCSARRPDDVESEDREVVLIYLT